MVDALIHAVRHAAHLSRDAACGGFGDPAGAGHGPGGRVRLRSGPLSGGGENELGFAGGTPGECRARVGDEGSAGLLARRVDRRHPVVAVSP